MYGDFSRYSFNRYRHYSAVLKQQGRVELDADANENTAILQHYMRTLARDIVGQHGGPDGAAGFAIELVTSEGKLTNLGIGAGRYYVDGLLVENEDIDSQGNAVSATYYNQPDAFRDRERAEDRLPEPPFLVYLKVWERHISALEDPDIREIALGANGPDTTTRAKVVWQVLFADKGPDSESIPADSSPEALGTLWQGLVDRWQPGDRGRLKAQIGPVANIETDVCVISPDVRYRRLQNQLYRVEIHTGGAVGDATFKWSRDNGSVAFAIESLEGAEVIVESLGRDSRTELSVGDLVEIVDDTYAVRGQPAALQRVKQIDPQDRRVILEDTPNTTVGQNLDLHPLLRRWDMPEQPKRKTGPDRALLVEETSDGKDKWIDLEDGVQIQFQPGATYRPGDYWLIPARAGSGRLLWPGPTNAPYALAPHGVEYHFAPLAFVRDLGNVVPLRRIFKSLAVPE